MSVPTSSDLKVDVAKPKTWARRLTITVPAERVERERRQVASGWAKKLRLPGFRKGKVPPDVLEKQYGAAIRQEALERVVGAAYREAVEGAGLEPITQAEVEDVDYVPGQDLTFRVEFEVRPEIELDRVGGFQVARPSLEVTEEDVARALERLREERAVWSPLTEGRPEAGDYVRVEITPLNEAEGASPEPKGYEFVLGEGRALEGVEDAIRTLAAGEEGEFTVAMPAEAAEGETEERRLRIGLVEAKRPELPELDDEFARELGDFEDLAALRGRIRADLESEAKSESERRLRRELLDRVLEANPFEVPDSMVGQYLERVLPARTGADTERIAEIRGQARPAAEHALKRMLVVDRLAEREGLRATSDEVDARVEEIAERRGRPPAEVWAELQKGGRLAALEDEITEEKVFGFLKSKSTVD